MILLVKAISKRKFRKEVAKNEVTEKFDYSGYSGYHTWDYCRSHFPEFGALKILADLFIKLIKMLIAPIIFLTVVIGIGSMGDMKKVGKIGGKALLYFEIVSTIALAIGIAVALIVSPGTGLDTSGASDADISKYTTVLPESEQGLGAFISSIIPENVVGALATGQLLPVLFSAVLFGLANAQSVHPQNQSSHSLSK